MESYSVLMSVYAKVKCEELRLSIESMLNQTVFPEQFVIVYDGPLDSRIQDTISGYCSMYPNLFTIVKLETNMGLAAALNAGLDACRNELVARMDSDDYSLPERCEYQLREFEKDKELALLGTMTKTFVDNPENTSEFIKYRPTTEAEIKKAIRRNSPFSHPSVMYKRSIVIKCGYYDPELRRSQDHDLFSKIINAGYVARNIDKVLLLFRADDSMMKRNKNKESSIARIEVQKRLLKRHECSIFDFVYIYIMMICSIIVPVSIYKKVYKILKSKGV